MAASFADTVESPDRLAGQNRVAMLLFRLGDPALFGINVFKMREVMRRPPIDRAPQAHALVAGSCGYRGETIPVIDLAAAMGYAPLRDTPSAHLMVTEFNRSVQGFLVADLQRLVTCEGESLAPPPLALGFAAYVNAVTRVDGELVAIIDVEHVLNGIHAPPVALSPQMQRIASAHPLQPRRVLVVDDSQVARRQVVDLFRQMEIECVLANDGREALDRLLEMAAGDPHEGVQLVVSDIEMPRLDGYALTRAIRESATLRHLKIVLHSSISGLFNEQLVRDVKADAFVAKFQPDRLAQAVIDLLPAPADDGWL